MRKFFLLLAVILLAVASIQLWVNKDRTSQKEEMEQSAISEENPIGGPFALTNQDGNVVHDYDFRGHVMLVFFGFSHCPDVCPVTVATLSKTMELLGDKAALVSPLFITVDPERDTSAVLKEFLSNFDKRIMGLTGTPEQIKKVGEAYKIYYTRSDSADKTPGKSQDKADYTIDHSAYIFMLSKEGKFIRVFPYNAPEQELAHAVETFLN